MLRVAKVRALRSHRHIGLPIAQGDTYDLPRHKLVTYLTRGWVTLVNASLSWHDLPGRELRITPTVPHGGKIVACCCIWQHANALAQTLPTWYPGIDALVIADGPYKDTGRVGPSTDQLQAILGTAKVPVHQVPWDKKSWVDQPTKRTALLVEASKRYPGSTLLIIDADEFLTGADQLRTFGGDVGWVRVTSPLYKRPADQPRLVQASPDLRYDQRHHWLYNGVRLVATHQYGGTGSLHQLLPVHLRNERNLGLTPDRLRAKHQYAQARGTRELPARQSPRTSKSDSSITGRETLRILQLATYDVGLVVYRLHTALNCTTPHASVMSVTKSMNPFQVPAQYASDRREGRTTVTNLAGDADVVHCHLNYFPLQALRLNPTQPIVIHHHGTMYRRSPQTWRTRDANACLRLVSNLELLQYDTNTHWLPNPMPVAEYRRLVKPRNDGVFRIAHSPSQRLRKGTAELIQVVSALQKKGLKIELVLVEKRSHEAVIRAKAICDAVFDSFWLGIQCSGLEGAAMGLPVIAGDPHVAKEYRERLGEVPYTYANDAKELTEALERLVTDPAWRAAEAQRVSTYCERYHDEASVALRYLDLLDNAIGWRKNLKMGQAG